MGIITKFDVHKEKKMLPNISDTPGTKLRTLRIKNNMTIKQLSNELNVSSTTIMHVEQNKIKTTYYYWKLICDYFKVDHINYLELYTMNENSIQDKLIKIRTYIGGRSWKEVGNYLGYSEGFIIDMLTRYIPNSTHIKKINSILEGFK